MLSNKTYLKKTLNNDHAVYRKNSKYWDMYVWANSVDSDQTAPQGAVWSGSTLFVILSASFEHNTTL